MTRKERYSEDLWPGYLDYWAGLEIFAFSLPERPASRVHPFCHPQDVFLVDLKDRSTTLENRKLCSLFWGSQWRVVLQRIYCLYPQTDAALSLSPSFLRLSLFRNLLTW